MAECVSERVVEGMNSKKAYSVPSVSIVEFDEDVSVVASSFKCDSHYGIVDKYTEGGPKCESGQIAYTDDQLT